MTQPRDMNREKMVVALSSVVAAIGLTSMKLVVGLLTGSLGILAEAAHSGLDLVSALLTRASICSLAALLDSGWEGPTEEPRSVNDTAANRVQLLLQALPTQYREVLTCR